MCGGGWRGRKDRYDVYMVVMIMMKREVKGRILGKAMVKMMKRVGMKREVMMAMVIRVGVKRVILGVLKMRVCDVCC